MNAQKTLRLWPGIALAVLLLLGRYVLPLIAPDGEVFGIPLAIVGVVSGVLFGVAIGLWWLFFSRARWSDRLLVLGVSSIALPVTWYAAHESIRGGYMGWMLMMFSIPLVGLALVAAAIVSRELSAGARRAILTAAIAVTCGAFTVIRTDGIDGMGRSDLHWRWTPTAEDRLLAASPAEPTPVAMVPPAPAAPSTPAPAASGAPVAPDERTPDVPAAANSTPHAVGARLATPRSSPPAPSAPPAPPAPWPGFRGPERDGVVRGLRISTDWSARPPVELWRHPIGPGWSSFSVAGDLIYTQEQRGEDELVSCYRLSTGEPVWRHADPVRFYESNGGAGPRGTPTVSGTRVFALGATGVLNALDAKTGARLWSRHVADDTGKVVPEWGITSSPLVVDDLVIVAVAGQLAAYDARTGEPRWTGQPGGAGYSSPHLVTIDGVPQVLLIRGSRTISVAPQDGTLLWEFAAGPPAVGIVQPAVLDDGSVLLANGDAMGGLGMRRVSVSRTGDGWTVAERWATRGLKPYFNDFVVHEGQAYGFDGSILAALDLNDGTRTWKGGRYGNGQMVLLPEQDLLLVVSEDGELALVAATPDQFHEVARVPALDAKTWNHPVVVGDLLLVRNGEEMAAFRLPTAPQTTR